MSKQIIFNRLLQHNKISLKDEHVKNRRSKNKNFQQNTDKVSLDVAKEIAEKNDADEISENTEVDEITQLKNKILELQNKISYLEENKKNEKLNKNIGVTNLSPKVNNKITVHNDKSIVDISTPSVASIDENVIDDKEPDDVIKILENENKHINTCENTQSSNYNVTVYGGEPVDDTWMQNNVFNKLINTIPKIKTTKIEELNVEKKVMFINFKPNYHRAYGGGNISTHYLQLHLGHTYSNFRIEYKLDPDTCVDVYLMIDPFKDKQYKLYGIQDIIEHRNYYNKHAKIIYRVNDCDITRPTVAEEHSREKIVMKYVEEVDIFIFNSNFVKQHYFSKYDKICNKENYTIHNGSDRKIFYGSVDTKILNITNTNKINIVTHHWSDNMFKGYQTYYDLWKYCKQSDIFNFVFIGKNVPAMFKDVPKCGPYESKEVGEKLRECHIYISDSKFDSCPNHVIEAIMCELPMLYTSSTGGGNELCNLSKDKIGESFSNFDELIMKLHKISNNYAFYKNNVIKARDYFFIENSMKKYNGVLSKIIFNNLIFSNVCEIEDTKGTTVVNFDVNCKKMTKILVDINGGLQYYFTNGKACFIVKSTEILDIKIYSCESNECQISIDNFMFRKFGSEKINNDATLNIMVSSDYDYFVGLFANLVSIVRNIADKKNINNIMFNYLITGNDSERFTNMITECETILGTSINKTIVCLCDEVIPKEIKASKCYNGGKHLLNIGNFARLLIGEIFSYEKLLYLDADSIVQCDLYEKLKDVKLEHDIYGVCANKENIDGGQHMVLKFSNILNTEYTKWKRLIGKRINVEKNVYMGVPFLTNCTKWSNVYGDMIKIVTEHNRTEGGLYKLFTMSLFNLVFYERFGNIEPIISTLADLGSKRKNWTFDFLSNADVLDWSGMFKPWFKNGLYQYHWKRHDILHLAKEYSNTEIDVQKKGETEKFKCGPENVTLLAKNLNISDINITSYTPSEFKNWDNVNKYIHNQIKSGCETYYNSLFFSTRKHRVTYLRDELDNTKFTLLCVVDIKHVITKMSRVRFWAYENLANRNDINLIYFGPGWKNWNDKLTLQENIMGLNIKFDFIEWYKPLDYNFDLNNSKLAFPTCIRYNEMWDVEWTTKEIDASSSNLIVCHHQNDYEKYKNMYENKCKNKMFFYNPHHANPNVFKNLNVNKDIDILLSGAIKNVHYPLRYRLSQLIQSHANTTLKNYRIQLLKHPGYSTQESFENKSQLEYNELINRSKICISCSSKHNYRLGKYVEIAMAGGVLCGDLPYEDKEKLSQFVIEVNMSMTDEEILNKILYYLSSPDMLKKMSILGQEWAKQFTPSAYSDKLYNEMILYKKKESEVTKKIYIVSEEMGNSHPEFKGEKWICDILKEEFMNFYPDKTTTNPMEADIIWYLAPWNTRFTPPGVSINQWIEHLKKKIVITTIHHIDKTKLSECQKILNFVNQFTTAYHAICETTYNTLLELVGNKPVYKEFLWINENVFFDTKAKKAVYRKMYRFKPNAYLVGSFQKDTEGKSGLPKLSKGPDIFVNIVKDMIISGKNVEVVLTGLRRTYLTNELDKLGIKYHYFNMASLETLNELYSCLDLYIVSARCEGGPRSIFEAGLTMTPIISTDVGIAKDFMPNKSIYDMNNYISYRDAEPDVKKMYCNISKLKMENQMQKVLSMLYLQNKLSF